jgi:nitrate reductase NapE component
VTRRECESPVRGSLTTARSPRRCAGCCAAATWLTFGLLPIVALALYGFRTLAVPDQPGVTEDVIDTFAPVTMAYETFLISIVAVGLYPVVQGRREARRPVVSP